MTTAQLLEAYKTGKLSLADAEKAIGSGGKETTCKVSVFKAKDGSEHSTLEFSGNFRPFSLGKSKLQAVLDCKADVEKFLKSA